MEALQAARAGALTVSCDLNFRHKSWKYGKSATDVMADLFRLVDVGIANEEDCQAAARYPGRHRCAFGPDRPPHNIVRWRNACWDAYPNLKMLAITLRESKSASHKRLVRLPAQSQGVSAQPPLRNHPYCGSRGRRATASRAD